MLDEAGTEALIDAFTVLADVNDAAGTFRCLPAALSVNRANVAAERKDAFACDNGSRHVCFVEVVIQDRLPAIA